MNGGEAHALLTDGGMQPVLLSLAEWVWLHREDASIVARYRQYVDWLIEHRPDVAEDALAAMDQYPWSSLGG
jgi:hypothetical protein